jgi:hypothetical protein
MAKIAKVMNPAGCCAAKRNSCIQKTAPSGTIPRYAHRELRVLGLRACLAALDWLLSLGWSLIQMKYIAESLVLLSRCAIRVSRVVL